MKSLRNSIMHIVLYILFGVLCLGLFKVFAEYYNYEMPSLSQADIPQETIDWFQNLIDGGWSDIGGILYPEDRDSSDWSRYEDIDSMLRVEDEYFIIYYSTKDSVVEKKKALISQRYAHEAVPVGELFMKEYPYPEKLNGRKLPIYLAKTEKDFRSICKQLGHGDPGTWAIGLYCFQYGPSGVYTDGIIISPKAWSVADMFIDAQTKDEELQKTLWHEMNHFMYFTNWNYFQISKPSLWFTEGLAEYFAENYGRLIEVGDHTKYELTKDIQNGSEYWVGFSAFLSLEQKFNKSTISDLVGESYDHSIDEAVERSISGYNLDTWNAEWHAFMQDKAYKKYMK